MQVKLAKWGNSLAVRLPGAVLAETKLLAGSTVDVVAEGGELRLRLVKPARRKRYTLDELLKGITPENVHPEIDWGPDVGREAIE
ncbi:MAG: AbrB/MazE/SpoVT family DNA-binding domain-containing protein [Panacagrimonas sp.]